MRRTYKFRLYPNKSQRRLLEQTLETCRWVYNETLATRKNAWEQEQRSVSLYDTNKLLPAWKQEHPELSQVYSQVLQNVQTRVDLAYQAFFRRVKAGETPGYPRFKGRGRYDSFTYTQRGFRLEDGKLTISKIGTLKVVQHREIPGKIKTLTIQRDAVGNWYACFSCEDFPTALPMNKKAVGIDVGLSHFATLSNGEQVDNQRFFRKDEKELAKAQRKLSVAEKGTTEYKRRKRTVDHIYSRITNRRRNFAHQLSHQLVNTYGVIAFEDLNIQRMMQNHRLAKSIGDAAWRQLVQFTTYKAEEAGGCVVLVDPRGTSQRCSRCGVVVKKTLADRVHKCDTCGLEMDRDINASINILALGLQCLGVSPRSPGGNARE